MILPLIKMLFFLLFYLGFIFDPVSFDFRFFFWFFFLSNVWFIFNFTLESINVNSPPFLCRIWSLLFYINIFLGLFIKFFTLFFFLISLFKMLIFLLFCFDFRFAYLYLSFDFRFLLSSFVNSRTPQQDICSPKILPWN